MKICCAKVCFISLLIVSEVYCLWNSDEELLGDVFEIDSQTSDEDYPQYNFPVDFGGLDSSITTEENSVNTDEERPKPDPESPLDEDDLPGSTNFEPQPDVERISISSLAENVEKLLTDYKVQQDKITELEEANKRLILKIDSIEQQVKTNSIILTNVRQEPNETSKITLQKVLHVFNRIMRVRISASDIEVALRAESNSSSDKNRPIVVRFANFATKMKILAASNRLSPTDISVSSDYSELVAQKRAALVPFLQRARAEGHRAFILYDRLVVDGVKMTLEELRAHEGTVEQVEMLVDIEPCDK